MKRSTIPCLLALWLCSGICQGQHTMLKYNLGFEESYDKRLADGWIKWGPGDFGIVLDSSQVHSGKFSTLITPKPQASVQSFGSVAYPLAANFDAKTVTLVGYMKIEDVSDGFAGLLLRIDGDGKTLQFDNMQNRKIQGTHDWKKYSITLPLPKEAEKIYVAGLLQGKGKAWFDSFEVFIDDKRIQDAKPIERIIVKAKAEMDQAFDGGSQIKIESLTTLQQQSLVKLGKVWGFLKYYHPTIRKGDVNWDYELFRVLPGVLKAKSGDAVNQELTKWVAKLGELKKKKTGKDAVESELKFKTNLDWISDQKYLGKQLSELLLTVQQQDRDGKGYYADLHPGVRNPKFMHEATYKEMNPSDDGFVLLGLYRYWNMIEYFFPYKHLTDDKWDNVLNDFIPKMTDVSDELSYKLTILELIGKVQDTHANIWQRDETLNQYWGRKTAPIQLKWVEDKVVINKVINSDFALRHDLKPGDVITHVNDIAVKELIVEKIKYSPASNLATQYRDVMRKLLQSNLDSLTIKVENESGAGNKTIALSLPENYRDVVPSHKLLEGNIGYIYPGSLAQGEINDIMKKFETTKGLVVDLRCYPSDFIVFSLSQYLNPEPKDFVKFTKGSVENPGHFSFTEPLSVGERNDTPYKGKVIIIINELTQSQAEYTTMALRASPNATVIGSTTAGADGNVSEIYLPGNVRTMISGIGVYYPDGRETQRIGIVPDIEVKPTIKGIRSGRDELLDKAIELINN